MADGSVIINAKIDTSGVKVGEKDLKESVKRMAASVQSIGDKTKISIEKQIVSLQRMGAQFVQQKSKVDNLKKSIDEISDKKVETEEYISLGKEIDRLYEKSTELEKTLNDWRKIGFSEVSGPFKDIEKELSKVIDQIIVLENKQKEMKRTGTAYVDQKSTKEYADAQERLAREEQRLYDMNGRLSTSFASIEQRIEECSQKARQTSGVFSKLGESVSKFSNKLMRSGVSGLKRTISNIGRTITRLSKELIKLTSTGIRNGLNRISGGIFAIHKSANKSTLSLKNLLKYAFGIRSLFALLNRIRSAAKEGIDNLARYEYQNGISGVNTAIYSLISSLTRLKNSFATAFSPIITTVAPILVRFINLVSAAVTRIGMLIAALTGQKTFIRAIGVQENYAGALDKTADSANKAAKAIKGYMSPLDEMERYEVNDRGSAGGSGAGSGGIGDMFEEVPIESSLKGIADKIREFIEGENWSGLGQYIADGINEGIEKVYDVISWTNVGPKVKSFVLSFTRTFNSLVDNIDFELLGRTAGSGINTIVNTIDLFIRNIDWHNLGRKFANGVYGLVTEVNAGNLGKMLGHKIMAAWDIFSGFVHNLPYRQIGRFVADMLNDAFANISISDIAESLTFVVNGAFESLDEFTRTFNWDDFALNVKEGIKSFVNDIKWQENGKIFRNFLLNLCDAINDSIDDGTFYEFGKGVGEFIGELPWLELLRTAAKAILDGIAGAMEGMWKSEGLDGKIAAVISAAFMAVKVGEITGITHLSKLILGFLGKKLTNNMIPLKNATSGTATAFNNLAASISPLVGEAGLIVLLSGASICAAKGLASLVETMQGGNGILSETGGSINDLAGEMVQFGIISNAQAEEISKIVDACESSEMSADQMVNTIIQKFKEWGLSTEQMMQVLNLAEVQNGKTIDSIQLMTESVDQLGDGFSENAGKIDLSGITVRDAFGGIEKALQDLALQGGEFEGTYRSVLWSLDDTKASSTTAQQAFDAIVKKMEDAGVPVDDFIEKMGVYFPNAVVKAEKQTDSSMNKINNSVDANMGEAADITEKAAKSIETNTKSAMSASEKSVSDSTEQIAEDSAKNWGDSYGSVFENLDGIETDTKNKMGSVMTTIQSYWQSVLINTNQIWERISNKISTEMGNALYSVQNNAYSIINTMNNVIYRVNNGIGNVNRAIASVERGFNFSYTYTNPVTNARQTYRSYLNLPRASTVPYLASGAVIPPRAEFLAVLGDQSNGRNLEAPEALLRQIVREESGNGNNGGNYRFTAQINRRTLFDELVNEAKLRRDTTGKNPFDLD